jgi:hypothetical protein
MSKRKQRGQPPAAQSRKPSAATAQHPAAASKRPILPIALGVLLIGGALIGAFFALRSPGAGAPAQVVATALPTRDPNAKPWPPGGAARCAASPKFVPQVGFDPQRAAISTSEQSLRGLALVEIGANGDTRQKGRIYQHPSWRAGGFLGPIARDASGNLFVGPVPVISVQYNKPGTQNDLYRVDSLTGVLTRTLSLPAAQASDATNPFGILGLTLDCDTNSLYVSSVMGSTRAKEAGRIFRIDLATNSVVAQIEGVDALGIGVFNGAYGKRLYIGHARTSSVRSIALDDAGNFKGEPRAEFSLEGLGPRGDDHARRITFTPDQTMQIFGVEFGFNLIAPTEKQETQYRFRYDGTKDAWERLGG